MESAFPVREAPSFDEIAVGLGLTMYIAQLSGERAAQKRRRAAASAR